MIGTPVLSKGYVIKVSLFWVIRRSERKIFAFAVVSLSLTFWLNPFVRPCKKNFFGKLLTSQVELINSRVRVWPQDLKILFRTSFLLTLLNKELYKLSKCWVSGNSWKFELTERRTSLLCICRRLFRRYLCACGLFLRLESSCFFFFDSNKKNNDS